MPLFREGKARKHPEGVTVTVWLGDDTRYAQVYGASEQEARLRAGVVVRLLNENARER